MNNKKPPLRKVASAVALASLPSTLFTTTAIAQQQEVEGLEEIVVTASRRSESLQDVAINIAAVSGDQIEDLRLVGINEVSRYVPGLTVIDRGARDSGPDLFVRGLNTTALGPGLGSPTVAIYMGDIPLAADFKTYDLERVEVLIGPQGTLYGQGTMGGAIRYIPKRADATEFSANVRADISKNSESSDIGHTFGAMVNIPLVQDVLALRANFEKLDDPGFVDYNFVVREAGVSDPDPDFSNPSEVAANLRRVEDANGEETKSARINLRWTPNESIDANLWYLYQDTDAEGRQLNNRLSFGTGNYVSGSRYLEPNSYKFDLVSAEVKADLGFAEASVVYGHTEYEEEGNRDQTDLLLGFQYGYELFPTFSAFTRETIDRESDTLEVRFTSTTEGPLKWTVGYFKNELSFDAVSEEFTPKFDQFAVDNLGGVQLRPDAIEYIQLTDNNQEEEAVYGEVAWSFSDSFTATFGYRHYEFSVDNTGGFGLPLLETVFNGKSPTEVNGFIALGTNKGDDSGDLFKLNLAYDVNEDNLVYFTYSEGYRNGGVNTVPQCTPEQLASTDQQLCAQPNEATFSPDKINNYEIGYKGNLLDNRLSLTAALFYIDWTDLQVATATQIGQVPITGNGSTAESKGLELNGRWLISDNLQAEFAFNHINAELTERAVGLVPGNDVLVGARLPGHAENKFTLNLTYSTQMWGGDVDYSYGMTYMGDVYNGLGGPDDPLVNTNTGEPGDFGYEAIPSYDLHRVSATYRKDNWRAQLYVNNVFDQYYVTGTRDSRRFLQNELTGSGVLINGVPRRSYSQYIGLPRVIGINFSYDF